MLATGGLGCLFVWTPVRTAVRKMINKGVTVNDIVQMSSFAYSAGHWWAGVPICLDACRNGSRKNEGKGSCKMHN